MKLKTKIKLLKARTKELENIVKKDSIVLTDQCDPNVKVVISLRNGVFLTEKITTKITEHQDIITKDQSI